MKDSLFEDLFYSYYSSLLVYVRKFVSEKTIAEDILQEVFLSVWKNRNKIDFETQPIKPYLYKIAHNKALNYLRSEKSRKSTTQELDLTINKEMADYNQHNTLLLKEADREIKLCMEKLPPRCREVFISSRIEMMKNKEIASVLNISEKAVEKHITLALLKIKECLLRIGFLN